MERIWRRIIPASVLGRQTYAQCGEDIIIAFLFDALGVSRPSYIDIGAHDPSHLNNTKLLYMRGSRGINIEANPELIRRFVDQRQEDLNLNVGVVGEDSDGMDLDFYVMSVPTVSTFSREEAARLERETSMRVIRVLKVRARGLLKLVQEHCNGTFPDLMSVDIEGLDEMIVPSVAACEPLRRPKVICIETLVYEENRPPRKKRELIRSIEDLGYQVYADTHINTVFCRSDMAVFEG